MWAETVTRGKVDKALKAVWAAQNNMHNAVSHLSTVLGHYMENYSSIDSMARRIEAIAEDLRNTDKLRETGGKDESS